MNDTLIKYVENENGERCGVVAGVLDGNTVKIGWSHCVVKKDHFDKKRGLKIAKGRALAGSTVKIPPVVMDAISDGFFWKRCIKYFRQAKFIQYCFTVPEAITQDHRDRANEPKEKVEEEG